MVGSHISDNQNRLRRKIINAYKKYKIFNSGNKQDFIEYAIEYLDFKRVDLEKYLLPDYVVSLEAKNKSNDEDFIITDLYPVNVNALNSVGSAESQERKTQQFKVIDEAWSKQKDDAKIVISELLTREFLSEVSKYNISEASILALKNANFACKEMVNEILTNPNYELPSQQEIGEKFGLTKSGTSIKLKRFLLSLMK